MAARDCAEPRPHSALGLLLFIASLGALGVLILVVYDTALLYNLGRLGDRALLGLAAAAGLIAFRTAAALLPPRSSTGGAVAFVGHGLRRWLAFFFVPALAIRYGVVFGTPALAAGAGLLVAGAAGAYALRDTLAEVDREHRRRDLLLLLGRLGFALLMGATVAYAVVRWTTYPYYEAALLRAATVLLVTLIAVCALTDAAVHRARAARVTSAGTRHP
jgi:hypothetical protein